MSGTVARAELPVAAQDGGRQAGARARVKALLLSAVQLAPPFTLSRQSVEATAFGARVQERRRAAGQHRAGRPASAFGPKLFFAYKCFAVSPAVYPRPAEGRGNHVWRTRARATLSGPVSPGRAARRRPRWGPPSRRARSRQSPALKCRAVGPAVHPEPPERRGNRVRRTRARTTPSGRAAQGGTARECVWPQVVFRY